MGDLSAVHAQCTRSATIWESRRTRNPHFVVLGASLLFDNTYFCASFASDMAFWVLTPPLPIFLLFSLAACSFYVDFAPPWQPSMWALACVDLHPTSDAIVKVKNNMQTWDMGPLHNPLMLFFTLYSSKIKVSKAYFFDIVIT